MYDGARACRCYEFADFIMKSKIVDNENASRVDRLIYDLMYEIACNYELLKNGLAELNESCDIINDSEASEAHKFLGSYKKNKV